GVIPWAMVEIMSRTRTPADQRANAPRRASAVPIRMMRSSLAWSIAGIAAISSLNFFSVVAWLPQLIVRGAGLASDEAAHLLGLYSLIAFPGSVLVPILVARFRKTSLIVISSGLAMIIGYTGLIVAPSTVTWLWVVCIGLGQMVFPLVLVLI